MNRSESGRKGAKKFWEKFYADEIFRRKMQKAWSHPKKDPVKAKRAAQIAAKARWCGHVKKEKPEPIKRKKEILPENSEENLTHKIRLCGLVAGDGSLQVRREKKRPWVTHYDISFCPDHPSLIQPFVEAFESLYHKRPTIKKMKNFYILRVCSKIACKDLLSISSFGTKNWEIPLKFLSSDKLKAEWLRAFFDCEAHVGKTRIHVQSVNKRGMYQIKALLEHFDIIPKIYKYERRQKNWSTNYLLFIMNKKSRERYLNRIGFNHTGKQEKLKISLMPG